MRALIDNTGKTELPPSAFVLRALDAGLCDRLDEVVASPDWYPAEIDIGKRLISFLRLSRADYQGATFLDRRRMQNYESRAFNVDDLLLHCSRPHETTGPVHYIFHGAFCCSTLLARYLDLLPYCLVLKEPTILVTIAALSSPFTPSGAKLSKLFGIHAKDYGLELFALCMQLLGRTYSTNEVVVIKTNDLCNSFGHALLARDPRSKAIFLATRLRIFLLSTLKSIKRREWVKSRLRELRPHAAMFPVLAAAERTVLNDAQRAAYLWLINQTLCQDLLSRWGPDRVLPLDGDAVADAPGEVLRGLGTFLCWPIAKDQISRMLAHPTASKYSKFKEDPRPYDSKIRQCELEAWERQFCGEVNQGMEWASKVDQRLVAEPCFIRQTSVQCQGQASGRRSLRV